MKKQLLFALLACSGIIYSSSCAKASAFAQASSDRLAAPGIAKSDARADKPAEKKSFIIKPTPIKESVNTLKEQVGTSVQAALKEITTLQEKASHLLTELATTQRQLLKAGSSILHEKETFKKASKESLASARDNVKQLRSQVNRGTATINSLTQKPLTSLLATTTCLGIKQTPTT